MLLREGHRRAARRPRPRGRRRRSATARRCCDAMAEHGPDLAIVDVRMPPTQTDEGVARRRRGAPPPARRRDPDPQPVRRGALRVRPALQRRGGVGYLLKDRVADVQEFVAAAERVAAGGTVIDPEVVAQLIGRGQRRAARRAHAARARGALADGRGPLQPAIVERLEISHSAVEKHVRKVFTKLGLPETEQHHRRVLAVLTYLGVPVSTKSAVATGPSSRLPHAARPAPRAARRHRPDRARSTVAQRTVSLLDLAARHTTTEVEQLRRRPLARDRRRQRRRLTTAPAGAPLELVTKLTEGLRSAVARRAGDGDGTLQLSSSCGWVFGGNSCGVDYEIRVPAGTRVQVDASPATSTPSDLRSSQPVVLAASSGDIDAIGVTAPALRLSTQLGRHRGEPRAGRHGPGRGVVRRRAPGARTGGRPRRRGRELGRHPPRRARRALPRRHAGRLR